FVPEAKVENGTLSLFATNNGRLPYIERTTRLETRIRYLDENEEFLHRKTVFTVPAIYGFGDSKEVIRDQVPEGTCFIEIELNPNLTIKESNYINNRIELKICE